MTEMVLLGAGASQEAGVKTSFELAKAILEQLEKDQRYGVEPEVLAFVVAGLMFQRGERGQNPYGGVDVEEVLNAIQLLGRRNTLPIRPFIAGWHARIRTLALEVRKWQYSHRFDTTFGEIDRLVQERIREAFRNVRGGGSPYFGGHVRSFEFSQALEREVVTAEDDDDEGEGIFGLTYRAMLQALDDLVWIEDPGRVSYLRPLLRPIRSQGGLVIASLNYDNAIELLCADANIQCETGITAWPEASAFDADPKDGVLLLKLHGSIDWRVEHQRRQEGRFPARAIRRHPPKQRPDGANTAEATLLFGGDNKLTAEGPFLDLLSGFRRHLRAAQKLTIIGYSFRDAHVNEYVAQWLSASPDRTIRVVNANGMPESGFTSQLREFCWSRIELLAAKAGESLPHLWPDS